MRPTPRAKHELWTKRTSSLIREYSWHRIKPVSRFDDELETVLLTGSEYWSASPRTAWIIDGALSNLCVLVR